MKNILALLSGGDLRSIGESESLMQMIKSQEDFDELFDYLFYKDRLVVMRAADVIEKITVKDRRYLLKHSREIIQLAKKENEKELKWHLALLIPRLELTKNELLEAWEILSSWVCNKEESRIVRVNALQGLHDLCKKNIQLQRSFQFLVTQVEKENIPSINARIKKLIK